MFAAYNISGSLLSVQGLHVFNIQRAEQDDGVLVNECIHSARRVREMPSILGSLRGSLRCNDDPIFCDLVLFPNIPSVEQAMVGLVDRVLGVRIGSYCYYIILDSDTYCFWSGQVTDVFVGSSRDALYWIE